MMLYLQLLNLLVFVFLILFFYFSTSKKQADQIAILREWLVDRLGQNQTSFEKRLHEFNHSLNEKHLSTLKHLQDTLRTGICDLNGGLEKLTTTTEEKLRFISGQVEKKLMEGFEKTTSTFTDIVKRLALIDDAQRKLTELSGNVLSLQEILIDKRSRGAFGEIQLQHLVENVFPKEHVSFQHTLSNGSRVDCCLFLPEPTGQISIDSKFPLENYHRYTNFNETELERKQAKQAFRQDIKKHIQDVHDKYIIPGETSSGAILFIPAEAIFAEIHHHFPELVTLSHQMNVWLASPTTMMAILTTASTVLKNHAAEEHIQVIQEHLRSLSKDFSRFEERMTQLSKHIQQANDDVQKAHLSAKKITKRFQAIDKGEVLFALKSEEVT